MSYLILHLLVSIHSIDPLAIFASIFSACISRALCADYLLSIGLVDVIARDIAEGTSGISASKCMDDFRSSNTGASLQRYSLLTRHATVEDGSMPEAGYMLKDFDRAGDNPQDGRGYQGTD